RLEVDDHARGAGGVVEVVAGAAAVDDAALLAAGREVEDVARRPAGQVLGVGEGDGAGPVDVAGVEAGDVPGVDVVDDAQGVDPGVALETDPADRHGVAVGEVD